MGGRYVEVQGLLGFVGALFALLIGLPHRACTSGSMGVIPVGFHLFVLAFFLAGCLLPTPDPFEHMKHSSLSLPSSPENFGELKFFVKRLERRTLTPFLWFLYINVFTTETQPQPRAIFWHTDKSRSL